MVGGQCVTHLDPVLQFSNDRTFRDESQKLALDPEGHGDDEGHENDHLEDEESEDLVEKLLANMRLEGRCTVGGRLDCTGLKIRPGILGVVVGKEGEGWEVQKERNGWFQW